jgi:hypothetical protein
MEVFDSGFMSDNSVIGAYLAEKERLGNVCSLIGYSVLSLN